MLDRFMKVKLIRKRKTISKLNLPAKKTPSRKMTRNIKATENKDTDTSHTEAEGKLHEMIKETRKRKDITKPGNFIYI